MTQDLLAKAIALAAAAHLNQVDKSGKAYILHPIRVMQACEPHGLDAQIVAILHDVVEDTPITLEDLRGHGFHAQILNAVDAISQRKGERYFDYIHRCSENRLASVVKLADLDDNSRPERRFGESYDSLMRRYQKAREIIQSGAK